MDVLLVDDHPLFTAGMRCLLHGLDNALSMDEENTCEESKSPVTLLTASLLAVNTLPTISPVEHVPC